MIEACFSFRTDRVTSDLENYRNEWQKEREIRDESNQELKQNLDSKTIENAKFRDRNATLEKKMGTKQNP